MDFTIFKIHPMGNSTSKVVSDEAEIKKFSHFQAADVKDWLDFFNSNYSNGSMSVYDMESLFRMLFPLGQVEGFSSRLFRTINIGQTGLIDFSEFLIAFSILIKGSTFERLRWIFRFYDQDKDGVVSRDELSEGIEDLLKMIKGAISYNIDIKSCLDNIFTVVENTSGFLTFNDFEKLSESKHSPLKLFPFSSN